MWLTKLVKQEKHAWKQPILRRSECLKRSGKACSVDGRVIVGKLIPSSVRLYLNCLIWSLSSETIRLFWFPSWVFISLSHVSTQGVFKFPGKTILHYFSHLSMNNCGQITNSKLQKCSRYNRPGQQELVFRSSCKFSVCNAHVYSYVGKKWPMCLSFLIFSFGIYYLRMDKFQRHNLIFSISIPNQICPKAYPVARAINVILWFRKHVPTS